MSLKNILTTIENNEPAAFEEVSHRRGLLKSFGAKLAVMAVPVALTTLFSKKAYAKASAVEIEMLNLALTYKYFERAFYNKVLEDTSGFLVPYRVAAIERIVTQEAAHVDVFNWLITTEGGTPVAEPVFDLTGGQGSGEGPFKEALKDYKKMLAMAQTIEDAGVRMLKHVAIEVMGNDGFLTRTANIQSIEARHAAQIRLMRVEVGASQVRPWIKGNDGQTDNVFLQTPYNGEEVNVQVGHTITGINGSAVSADAATAAFDEPLHNAKVEEFLNPFIVP